MPCRILMLCAVLTLLTIGIAGAQEECVPGELLARFRPQASEAQINGLLSAYGARQVAAIPQIGARRLRLPESASPIAVAQALLRTGTAEYVEPNHLAYAVTVPNDPIYQWSLSSVNAFAGWDATTGSPNVVIAIVDTGVDYNHPDLSGKCVAGYDFVNNDSRPLDDYWHGTHVAGIAGASTNNGQGIAGIGWQCRIMPVKVLGADGTGSYWNVAQGIIYAADHGAHVINLSLAGPYNDSTEADAVRYALGKGCVVVAAVGNQGGVGYNYPAAYDGVIGAAALASDNTRASFSNYNASVDIAAPGVDVISCTLSSSPGGPYTTASGTSMAAPHVAGLAALIRSLHPDWTNTQIADQICRTADDLGPSGRDNYYGWGKINLARALGQSGPGQDSVPPTAAITSPAAGSALSGLATVTASGSDNVGVTRLELYVDGELTGTIFGSSGSFSWDTTRSANGAHTLTAKAWDAAGNSGTSPAVVVNVANGSRTISFKGTARQKSAAICQVTVGAGPLQANLSWNNSANLDLYLYNAQGGLVAAAATSAKPESLSVPSLVAGTYTFRIFTSSTAKYTLTVTSQ